jgi:lysophospholipase L1-like esterase
MSLKPWMKFALGVVPMLVSLSPLACSGDGNGGNSNPDADMSADAGTDTGGPDTGEPPPAGVVAAGVRWFGRVDITSDAAHPRFSWSGTGFVARFQGTSLTAQLNNGGAFIFKAVIDGAPQPVFTSSSGMASYPLATGLASDVHTVELYRQTEGGLGASQLMGLTVGDGALMDPPPSPGRLIEVVGDSISCGYGTLGKLADDGSTCFLTESHWDAYPSVMARALGAEVSTVAASGRGAFRNYGGDSVQTIPMIYGQVIGNAAAPLWDFHIHPQAVVINLGTNDIAKGDPGMPFQDSYQTLLETIRGNYPNAYIICIIGPLTNAGQNTTLLGYMRNAVTARQAAGDTQVEVFDQIAPQTADKAACSYHPNPAENLIMGGQLADRLHAVLGW